MPEVEGMSDLGVMTPASLATTTNRTDRGEVSPEVVLVDPDLAASARPLHVPHEQPPTRRAERAVDDEDRYSSIPRRHPVAQPDGRAIQARQRLLDAGIASDVLGSMVPRGGHFRRSATLIPAISAASSVILLVLQLYLGQGTL
jgi:hypothetical protein